MSKPVSYKRHRFPPEIIAHAVWLYFRFPLSLRLVEEMLLAATCRSHAGTVPGCRYQDPLWHEQFERPEP